MISLSNLRPHPFAVYGDFVDAIKAKASSIFGPRSLLLIDGDAEGFVGHLLDFTNLTSPQLYNLWAYWPSFAPHYSLTFAAYGKNTLREFFKKFEESESFVHELARLGQDLEQLKSHFYLLKDQSVANLVLLSEMRQDHKMQILGLIDQHQRVELT